MFGNIRRAYDCRPVSDNQLSVQIASGEDAHIPVYEFLNLAWVCSACSNSRWTHIHNEAITFPKGKPLRSTLPEVGNRGVDTARFLHPKRERPPERLVGEKSRHLTRDFDFLHGQRTVQRDFVAEVHGAQLTTTSSLNKPFSASFWTYAHLNRGYAFGHAQRSWRAPLNAIFVR